MSTHDRPLVGSVFERTTHPPSALSPRFNGTPGAGFPTAQHRFKSAFARAREGANAGLGGSGSTKREVPPSIVSAPSLSSSSSHPPAPALTPVAPMVDSKPIPTDTDALRRQIHEENARKIARMSEEEIEAEKRAILEHLGEGTWELVRRVQEARRRKEAKAQTVVQLGEGQQTTNGVDARRDVASIVSPTPHRVPHGLAAKPGVLRVKSLENIGQSVPSPLPATSSTRPSSRTGRKLRFAEVTPDDVHVYESAPRSPDRPVLALPPPPDTKDDSIVSLGTFNKNAVPFKRSYRTDGPTNDQPIHTTQDDEPEEGTPEYIRRRYFPSMPANDPSLAWMKTSSQEATDSSAPRFDLHGAPISASLSTSLPSHLGLHHHAQGSHAGYTLDDILLLTRSTVPAQRASMLGILAKIARRLSRQVRDPDSSEKMDAFAGQEGELRKRILAAGMAAIDQIGSLGAQAVQVVWECLVEWDSMTNELEGVELALAPDIISSLQLDYFLPQITDVFLHGALPPESLAQLLAVVHWLAQQSNKVADAITHTPRLIPTLLDTFLLTPMPPREGSLPPNSLALRLLVTLASASRANASALVDPADALLRFVTLLPSSSPYPLALASTLLTYTLQFYSTLASYGLYAHIASTASQVFSTLTAYTIDITNVSTKESIEVRTAWASLVEAWTVCTTDPHATSPPHDILWSQICAWGWPMDVRRLREGLGNETSNWAVYAAIWNAEAAWLEGARINGIKGGEAERQEALQTLKRTFSLDEEGTEFGIVKRAVEVVQRDLAHAQGPTTIEDGQHILQSLARAGTVLASSLRLFLACLPPLTDDGSAPYPAPPFALPLSALSALTAALVKHPIWSLPYTLGAPYLQVYFRPLTHLLAHFHRVSRYIPGTTPQLWFAQALVFLARLLPGDESLALGMLDAFALVTPAFAGIESAGVLCDVNVNMAVLRPFFEYTVRPEEQTYVYVAPIRPSTESISRANTLRLFGPHVEENDQYATRTTLGAGLPLNVDALFAPLTHLLRSGTSPVFRRRAGKEDWSASEVEVVRATLIMVGGARRVLDMFGLEAFGFGGGGGAAEVVFGCMRVCMLEHGVGGAGEGEGEVFRDAGVEWLMGWLLEPYTVRGRFKGDGEQQHENGGVTTTPARTLENVSAPYLGSTPFYQFYTDLVALYGAVSFGHRVFAALVVTPLAMGYPVDYRRAFWCGGESGGGGVGADGGSSIGGASLSDIVRSVRIPIEDVVCMGSDALREYLYPVERDVGVLGAYVAALVARVEGFLRFVAVHHVASMVWGKEGDEEMEIRVRLLRAVVVRGDVDVVKDMVLYRQPIEGALILPPACYQSKGGWEEERLAFVMQLMGESAVDRVRRVL